MMLARLLLRLKTRDVTSGFRCYRAAVVSELLRISIQSEGYAFQEETLMYCERLGFDVIEIPIVFRDRINGRSKLTWRDVGEFFVAMWRLRRVKPVARLRTREDVGWDPLNPSIANRTTTARGNRASSK